MKLITLAFLTFVSTQVLAYREWNVSCWSNGQFSMNFKLQKDMKESRLTIFRNGEEFLRISGDSECDEISVYQDHETTHTVSHKDIHCGGKTNELIASVYKTTTNRIIASFIYTSSEGVDFAQLYCDEN